MISYWPSKILAIKTAQVWQNTFTKGIPFMNSAGDEEGTAEFRRPEMLAIAFGDLCTMLSIIY